MNPRVGQLMTMIMPSDPAEVFEADLPDPEQLMADKLGQITSLLGKYGSTKAEPFTSKLDDLQAFVSDPVAMAQAKATALEEMAKEYGADKAAPLLASMDSLKSHLPDAITPTVLLEQVSPETLTEQAKSALANQDIAGLEVALMNEIGQPLAGQPFAIKLPDGKVAAGITDEQGIARVAGFIGGSCELSLPNVDKSIW